MDYFANLESDWSILWLTESLFLVSKSVLMPGIVSVTLSGNNTTGIQYSNTGTMLLNYLSSRDIFKQKYISRKRTQYAELLSLIG